MPDQVKINGNLFSWGSIKVMTSVGPFFGFTAIDYADKLEVAKGYGLGPSQTPRGRTRGKYTTEEVKLTAFLDSGQSLMNALAALSPTQNCYSYAPFQIMVSYVDLGNAPVMHTLRDCRIIGVSNSNAEGSDSLMTEFAIDCISIYRGNKTLFSSPL